MCNKDAGFKPQEPTWKAWLSLGRLIGYLRHSESFALRMEKCEKGQSFMETVLGKDTQRSRNNLEVCTDSDWAGAGDMKLPSAAIHTLNGLVISAHHVHRNASACL